MSAGDQDFTGAGDPARERFLQAVTAAEHWIGKAMDVGAQASDRALAVATVHARLAQAHATDLVALQIADLGGFVAELCQRLERAGRAGEMYADFGGAGAGGVPT